MIRKNLATWMSAGLLGFTLVILTFTSLSTVNVTVDNEHLERPPAPHTQNAIFADHPVDGQNCWTGDAPKDVVYPGHVIWQHPDGKTVYSKKLVDPALDAIFGDGDLEGRPIAFCR